MITAIKTTPPTVTPQKRPTKILMITAIKTTPPTVTPQIRPTKILMNKKNKTNLLHVPFDDVHFHLSRIIKKVQFQWWSCMFLKIVSS
jgi:hypothetical protein